LLRSEDIIEFRECYEKVLDILKEVRRLTHEIQNAMILLNRTYYETDAGEYIVTIGDYSVEIKTKTNKCRVFKFDLSDPNLYEVYGITTKYGIFIVKALERYISEKEQRLKELRKLFNELKDALMPVLVENSLSK